MIEIVPVKQKLKGGKYNDKEEREQDQKVRDLEQVEVWVEVKVAEDVARGAVLRQARAVTAFAPTVVKEQPINWGSPVMNSNAQNVVPP